MEHNKKEYKYHLLIYTEPMTKLFFNPFISVTAEKPTFLVRKILSETYTTESLLRSATTGPLVRSATTEPAL
jgi:hypothetical protein